MSAYYNEFDPFAAAWLRALIADGLIAPGEVDERSIKDVSPDDLNGFTQCHFFAGIGGWSYAMRLAGWADDRPTWSGSCPCQPLSGAGQRKGHDDSRHLWPAFYGLISQRRPATIFGEQVASADGREWLAGIRADLEALGYAVGSADLCSAGVGAPHIRQRLYWLANADSRLGRGRRSEESAEARCAEGKIQRPQRERHGLRPIGSGGDGRMANTDGGIACDGDLQRGRQHGQQPQDDGVGWLVHAGRPRFSEQPRRWIEPARPSQASAAGGLGDSEGAGPQRQRGEHSAPATGRGGQPRHAKRTSQTVLIPCTDGKWRRVPANEAGEPEPALFPLATGIPNRVGTLRGAGNAIDAGLASDFIQAADEAMTSVQTP